VLNFFPEEVHPQVRLNLALNLKGILSQRLVKTVDGGRIPAIEVLINTPRIADLIDQWEIGEIKEAMAAGKNYGMQTFDQHLLELWKQGVVSEDEALKNADSVNDLRLKMKMSKLEANEDGGNIDELVNSSTADLKI
jgi:twitching motility protein PilU